MNNWDQSGFDQALQGYLKVTSRTLQQVLNTKLYYIARRAIWNTRKADTSSITQQLGSIVTVSRLNRNGKTVRKRVSQLVPSSRVNAPLAALIINARRAKAGLPGLYGKQMERAVKSLLGARMRSVAFIKSGFVPGVRILEPFADRAGAPASDSSARIFGRPKGTATPAPSGYKIQAELVNLASAHGDKKGALVRYGSEGLDKAFQDEAASMIEYIERKMKPDADEFNRRAA